MRVDLLGDSHGNRVILPRALFFDQDGVIVDTERDGHRVAFNRAFAEAGLAVEWDEAIYHQLLSIGGGKERMRHYLHAVGFGRPVQPEEEESLIQALHRRKTDIFVRMIETGSLPLRPGVHRLMRQCSHLGTRVGVCTTSNEHAARAILRTLLPDITVRPLLSGDVVQRKKPDPEIYLLALRQSGLDPGGCLVVEDSQIGIEAAAAAGLPVLATVNDYTASEDLSKAKAVVTSLGDPGIPCRVLRGPEGFAPEGIVRLEDCGMLIA